MERNDSTEYRQFTLSWNLPVVRPELVRSIETHLEGVVDDEEIDAMVSASRTERGIDGEYKTLVVDFWISEAEDLNHATGELINATVEFLDEYEEEMV